MANIPQMETLETGRLSIRDFCLDDLEEIHRILDIELEWGRDLEDRKEILQDAIGSATQANPPLAIRAVVLKGGGTLIGQCGYETYFLSAPRSMEFSGRHQHRQSLTIYYKKPFGL